MLSLAASFALRVAPGFSRSRHMAAMDASVVCGSLARTAGTASMNFEPQQLVLSTGYRSDDLP